jgi:cell division protein FtsW
MFKKFDAIQGDKVVWAIAGLLALASFLPVYSSSSNLAYLYGNGNTLSFLIKHAIHLSFGLMLIYVVHRFPYNYFKGLSYLLLVLAATFLVFTLLQGTTIQGANASRWIRIPGVGISFQPSIFAMYVLMVYTARYLSKMKGNYTSFKSSIIPLWIPVFTITALILPANLSTAVMVFGLVLVLAFIGGYPMKYLLAIVGAGIVGLALFILIAKIAPDFMPNRVDTWMSRIENFRAGENAEDGYQIEKAKIAIATGGVMGLGPGKSVQKNFLPQSSSDFIYAIIVEEFGLLGAGFVMLLYLWLLFRIMIITNKVPTMFGKLTVIGVGLPIIFQALINMAVAVELFPVTGQTLPLISSGGTSIGMTCLALGIILSVSANKVVETKGKDNPLEVLIEENE